MGNAANTHNGQYEMRMTPDQAVMLSESCPGCARRPTLELHDEIAWIDLNHEPECRAAVMREVAKRQYGAGDGNPLAVSVKRVDRQ